MTGDRRPLRPGDAFRVGRGFPRSRVDEDAIDFLRVHYETDSPGLGRVVEVSDAGMTFLLWGHLFQTPVRADDPGVRRLGGVVLLLAKERIGEWILRREIEAGRVVPDTRRPPTRHPLVRAWLRRTRGELPILERLGGRVRVPIGRKAKSRLYYWLGRLGALPPLNGFLDHGTLVDRIGVPVELEYSDSERTFELDRILLHKNHSIHLVGVDLGTGKQRTFRLDKVWGLAVPGVGAVDRDDLYWELQALCMSRAGWLWYWNRHRERKGLPPGPPIGVVGRAVSRLGMAFAALGKAAAFVAGTPKAVRRKWVEGRWAATDAWAAGIRRLKPPGPAPEYRPREPPSGLPWRSRLLKAAAVVEAGGREQVTCLLPMNALLEADPAGCRLFLRHLLEVTLEEAKADVSGHPQAAALLEEALAIGPAAWGPIEIGERSAAKELLDRIRRLQPGSKRVWVRATRRRASDARLLLCEDYLSAVYHVREAEDLSGGYPVHGPPEQWGFYRVGCHFVSRWESLRFRMDAGSAPRLRAVVEWWDARSEMFSVSDD